MALDSIRFLIGQSQTVKALEALTTFLNNRDKTLYDDCLIQLARYHSLAKTYRHGSISSENYSLQINQINFSLVEILQLAERQFINESIDYSLDSNSVSNPNLSNLSQRHSTFNYDFFLSFSSKDKTEAFNVFEQLTKARLKVFFSGESLKRHSGQAFSEIVSNAIENSQHFILFCSENALSSTWVKIEWETFFNECHIPNPYLRSFHILKGTNFPQDKLPLLLKRIQYTEDLSDIISVFGTENSKPINKDEMANTIQKIANIESNKEKEQKLLESNTNKNNKQLFLFRNRLAVGIICIALVGLLVWKYIYQLSRPNQNLSYNIENKDTSNQKSIQNSTTKATPIIQEQSSNQNEKSKVVAENAEKVNYTKLKKTPQVEKNSIKYQKVDGNQLEQDRLTAEAIEKSNRIKAAQKQLKNAQSYCEGGLTAKAISALSAVNISDLPKSLQKKIVDAKAFLEGGFEDKAARIIAEAIKEL